MSFLGRLAKGEEGGGGRGAVSSYNTIIGHFGPRVVPVNVGDRRRGRGVGRWGGGGTSIGRSDLARFLLFSKSDTFLPIRFIFRSSIPKNRQLRLRTSLPTAKFSFSKNYRDIKK